MREDDPMTTEDRRGDFELIRGTLLQMDSETRHQVIEAMKALRACPRPVAVRVLADAAVRSQLARPRLVG
jgi:hypothetical protein